VTRAEAFRLIVERYNKEVEEQLEAASIDLADTGATPDHVEDELAALRVLFEAHRDRQIAEAAQWVACGGPLH
jgi:hypothetical protein